MCARVHVNARAGVYVYGEQKQYPRRLFTLMFENEKAICNLKHHSSETDWLELLHYYACTCQ